MKRATILFTAALITLALACGGRPAPGVPGAVLTVGERSLLPEDVEQLFERHRGDSASVDVFLENILARELFLAHSTELGLDQSREVQRLIHERSREILQGAWLTWELDKVELEPGAAQAYWESMGTGVVYTALSLRDSVLMEDVYQRVRAGDDLADFAEVHGLEDLTRGTRGNISLPDRRYANLMDLDHLAGDIRTGDIIGPFTVPVGYRMLQMDSVWVYDPDPFSVDSSAIARMLLARVREERKVFVEDSLKNAFGVTVNPEVLEMMNGRTTEGGFSFQDFSPAEEDQIVVHWHGGSRDVFSVYRNIDGLPGYMPRRTDNETWLREYAERLAMFDIQMQLAIDAGLDTISETARMVNRKTMEVLLDEYYQQIISPAISPEMAMLDSIYLQMRETRPHEESRVFNVLYLDRPERIEAAQRLMDSGIDMMTRTEEFELFPPVLAPDEDYLSAPLQRSLVPDIHREVFFGMEPGEEALIHLDDTTGLWIRLLEIEPERLPEFEEIRTHVVRAAEAQLESQVIAALVDSLHGVYHPYVDTEYFKQFYVPAADEDSMDAAAPGEVD